MKTILLVEDDLNLADGLVMNLEAEGYQVVHVAQGAAVMEELSRGMFDAVLLDLSLPDSQGLGTAAALLEAWPSVPLVVLVSRGAVWVKIRLVGLATGVFFWRK